MLTGFIPSANEVVEGGGGGYIHQGHDLVALTLTFVLKIAFFGLCCCRRHNISQTHAFSILPCDLDLDF